MEPEQLNQELNELGPTYWRRIAIVSGICSATGFAIASYVYIYFSHSETILYRDRTDTFASETVVSYLFVFPIVMAILCIWMTLSFFISYFPKLSKKGLEFSAFLRRNNEDMFKNITRRPLRYPQSAKSILEGMTILAVLVDMFLLAGTIYRSYLIAVRHFG
jgi:hypothetical protein